MKGFALDENGDLLIINNEIVMIHGTDLLRQKVETVLNTNKGEWSLNVEEGINFSNILGKNTETTKPRAKSGSGDSRINDINSKAIALSQRLSKRLDGEL